MHNFLNPFRGPGGGRQRSQSAVNAAMRSSMPSSGGAHRNFGGRAPRVLCIPLLAAWGGASEHGIKPIAGSQEGILPVILAQLLPTLAFSSLFRPLAVHGLGKAVALTRKDNDVGVVDQAVNEGRREPVVPEDGVPLAELQV